MITVDTQPRETFIHIHDLVRMALPGYRLEQNPGPGDEGHISVAWKERGGRVVFSGSVSVGKYSQITAWQKEYLPDVTAGGNPEQLKLWARSFTYQLLCLHLERNFNQYGILTGVRPVKLVHNFMDQGLADAQILDKLTGYYLISPDKACLLLDVAKTNRWVLTEPTASAQPRASIYIGIPFCPSRCSYCSFPGAVIRDYGCEVGPFVDALIREMEAIGDHIMEQKWQIDSIYIGGGTPTVLSALDWDRIFSVLHHKYISAKTSEMTVEAGRPDTMCLALLNLLQQAGVNRICVNPQSMQDQTLRSIGRCHDSQMVIDAVEWARQAGIKYLNMDMIVGLPGEGLAQILSTAEKLLELGPDNITTHTLAIKKGSELNLAEGRAASPRESMLVEQGMVALRQLLQTRGYRPYYLYRQKYMRANQENIGYALKGSACRYNVEMIEERQTIIGMGGGASTKLVQGGAGHLTNLHNPKDPRAYIAALPRLIGHKVDKLGGLN